MYVPQIRGKDRLCEVFNAFFGQAHPKIQSCHQVSKILTLLRYYTVGFARNSPKPKILKVTLKVSSDGIVSFFDENQNKITPDRIKLGDSNLTLSNKYPALNTIILSDNEFQTLVETVKYEGFYVSGPNTETNSETSFVFSLCPSNLPL